MEISLWRKIKNFLKDNRNLTAEIVDLKKEIRLLANNLQEERESNQELRKTLLRMDSKINSILRHSYRQDTDDIFANNEYYNLINKRFQCLSQNEEDGVILELFKRVGVTNRQFVEIGSGRSGGNSGFLAKEFGWTGLMVDSSEQNIELLKIKYMGCKVTGVASFITKENINELLEKYGFTGEQDLMSIDIDGNDYWIWEALNICSPRLMIMEYNCKFGRERSVTIPYEYNFSRREAKMTQTGIKVKGYHGASLAALDKLASKKGYRLVGCDVAGVNAFFLRNDVKPSIPKCEILDCYRVQSDKVIGESPSDFFEKICQANLELVEIE